MENKEIKKNMENFLRANLILNSNIEDLIEKTDYSADEFNNILNKINKNIDLTKGDLKKEIESSTKKLSEDNSKNSTNIFNHFNSATDSLNSSINGIFRDMIGSIGSKFKVLTQESNQQFSSVKSELNINQKGLINKNDENTEKVINELNDTIASLKDLIIQKDRQINVVLEGIVKRQKLYFKILVASIVITLVAIKYL